MDLLIVSGLSGAGKSVAMNALEDIGFFCIDNVPAELLPSITAFSKAGDNQLKRVALSMDVRGCHTSEQIEQALHQLDEQGIEYEILFIDAPDDVLMRRYSETRRRHPISIAEGISTREALAKERQILQPFRERADYTINTEFLSTAQNKERICNLFAPDGGAKAAMRLTVMSFGFKFGIPEDSRIRTDGRFLKESVITEEKLAQIRTLNEIAAARGQTLAEMALAWILRDGKVTSVLIGASKPQQILDNIAALNNTTFTADELEAIDKASGFYKE